MENACVDGAARTGLPGTATKSVSQDTSEAKGICASSTLKDEGVQDGTL
jgi:hypothetical protein